MTRKVKCLYCGEFGKSGEFYKVPKDKEGKRFSYYCSSDEYNLHVKDQEDAKLEKERLFIEKELIKLQKQQEREKYKDLMEFVMDEIYNYEKGMVFPSSLVMRIKKLRGFYEYNIIKEAFKESYDAIMWAMSNRNFPNEYNKTSYIMAIVESKINDIYLEVKREEKQVKKTESFAADDISLSVMNDVLTRKDRKSDSDNGISWLLEDDEL